MAVPPKDQHYFSSRILCENAALQAIWDGFDAGYRVRSAVCKLVWVETKLTAPMPLRKPPK
jgi:hypothetical protein